MLETITVLPCIFEIPLGSVSALWGKMFWPGRLAAKNHTTGLAEPSYLGSSTQALLNSILNALLAAFVVSCLENSS